jgi:hypothetical protein
MAEIGLVGQAKSILGVLRASLKNGKVLATAELVEERLGVCESCPHLKEKRGKFACVKCGCGYKKKVAFHNSECPIGKW